MPARVSPSKAAAITNSTMTGTRIIVCLPCRSDLFASHIIAFAVAAEVNIGDRSVDSVFIDLIIRFSTRRRAGRSLAGEP